MEGLKSTISTLAKARDTIVVKGMENLQDDTERQDLLVFVSYLDGRIYYYCEQLADIGGSDALSETICPKNLDGTLKSTQFAAIPVNPSLTSEEKLSALDSSFNESLGTFDEMLLKEQQKVASHTPRQREDGNQTGTGFHGTQQGSGENGSGTGYSDRSGTSDGNSGSRSQPTTTGTGSNSGNGSGNTQQSQTPPTAGNKDLSQTDDDIIAKQLKEAAEQETDPEVKAKLWDEYRKYKEGIR